MSYISIWHRELLLELYLRVVILSLLVLLFLVRWIITRDIYVKAIKQFIKSINRELFMMVSLDKEGMVGKPLEVLTFVKTWKQCRKSRIRRQAGQVFRSWFNTVGLLRLMVRSAIKPITVEPNHEVVDVRPIRPLDPVLISLFARDISHWNFLLAVAVILLWIWLEILFLFSLFFEWFIYTNTT